MNEMCYGVIQETPNNEFHVPTNDFPGLNREETINYAKYATMHRIYTENKIPFNHEHAIDFACTWYGANRKVIEIALRKLTVPCRTCSNR